MSKKRVGVLLAEGFEEIEALTIVDYLRRANLLVDTISVSNQKQVTGSHDIPIIADFLFSEIPDRGKSYDLIYLPGGLPGSTNLRDNPQVIKLIQDQVAQEKYVAAICAAPIVLEKAGLTQGRKGTSYPGFVDQVHFDEYLDDLVVQDGLVISSRGPATAVYLALDLIELLAGKEQRDKTAQSVLIPLVEEKIK